MERGGSVSGGHEWLRALAELPFQRVRLEPRGTKSAAIEVQRVGDRVSYLVIGNLTVVNQLRVPGRTFSIDQMEQIEQWLDGLRTSTQRGPATHAFGLSAEELVQVHGALGQMVRDATAGRTAREIVRGITADLPFPILADAAAKRALTDEFVLPDELGQLSSGTALAAALRPLGLVFSPAKRDDRMVLLIRDFRQAEESWPIGWPLEGKPKDVAPKLYDFVPIEIADVLLADALAALQQRTEIPVLFDHNGLVRQRIDPSAVTVSIPATKTYYNRIFQRILFQAKLRNELRVDERGQPFLWISPLKK